MGRLVHLSAKPALFQLCQAHLFLSFDTFPFLIAVQERGRAPRLLSPGVTVQQPELCGEF